MSLANELDESLGPFERDEISALGARARGGRCIGSNVPVGDRRDQSRPTLHARLSENAREMKLHGARRARQAERNLLVRLPLENVLQNAMFGRREPNGGTPNEFTSHLDTHPFQLPRRP